MSSIILKYALLLMAQQLNHVYNEEGCTYGDTINEHKNIDTVDGYIVLAFNELKGLSPKEIDKKFKEVGELDGHDH